MIKKENLVTILIALLLGAGVAVYYFKVLKAPPKLEQAIPRKIAVVANQNNGFIELFQITSDADICYLAVSTVPGVAPMVGSLQCLR